MFISNHRDACYLYFEVGYREISKFVHGAKRDLSLQWLHDKSVKSKGGILQRYKTYPFLRSMRIITYFHLSDDFLHFNSEKKYIGLN
jgi:hypothetical protein